MTPCAVLDNDNDAELSGCAAVKVGVEVVVWVSEEVETVTVPPVVGLVMPSSWSSIRSPAGTVAPTVQVPVAPLLVSVGLPVPMNCPPVRSVSEIVWLGITVPAGSDRVIVPWPGCRSPVELVVKSTA